MNMSDCFIRYIYYCHKFMKPMSLKLKENKPIRFILFLIVCKFVLQNYFCSTRARLQYINSLTG